MPAHLLQHALRRPWLIGAGAMMVATLALSGCDLSGLTGSQCTPQTCDYIVNTLVAASGSSGVNLLADSNNTVYQLSGTTWNKVGAESFTQRGDGLIASPNFASDNTLFLGDSTSTDGGKTWSPLCVIVKAVSPSFASDHTVFGVDVQKPGSGSTASSSTTSSGTTGTSTPAPTVNCPSSAGSFYISTDGGQNWTAAAGPQGAGDPDIFVLSPAFKTDKTIFAGFTVNLTPALYKSTDGGSTWTQVLSERQHVVALSTNFAQDHTIIAVSNDKEQISTDGGQSWNTLKSPITPDQIASVVFSPNYSSDKTIVLISSSVDSGSNAPHGTFVSTDGGNTWTNNGPVVQRGANEPPFIFSPDYSSDKTVYTSSLDQAKGPAISTDLGKTWTAVNNGLTLEAGLGG
jgi:hypothetical protein